MAPEPEQNQRVLQREIEDEMKTSYLDYAMSVLVSRALPDIRDGLKPVQRRILYTMYRIGLLHNKAFRKSATIIGNTMARYHPHGDAAIYDALVRMAQDFSLRYPLVDGQGNWGSIDGDRAAAFRYCVTGDTRIVTDKGLVKIGEISDDEDISVNVLSKDKNINTASKWFDSGFHKTLKIVTRKGYKLQGSYNHPILIWTIDNAGRPGFAWRTLDKVKPGDIAVLDRNDVLWPKNELELQKFYPKDLHHRVEKKILPHTLNSELALLLGAICSEGSIGENKIEFCNSDKVWIDDFTLVWKMVFPDCRLHVFKKKPSSYGKKEYYRLEIHSKYVLAFLRNIGLLPLKSRERVIPETIFYSPRHIVACFLRSYFEGDGSISGSIKTLNLNCCSTSEKLIEQLQLILLRFGIDSFKRFDNYRNTYKLSIRSKRNVFKFNDEIGFLSERKTGRLLLVLSDYKKDWSTFDYVPYVSDYVRSLFQEGKFSRFVEKHNFDRYSSMEQNSQTVSLEVKQKSGVNLENLFNYLLTQHYLFEEISSITEAGPAKVYSIKVNSDCHSFIGNGFINHNTEARLKAFSEELLLDIDKKTVDFVPNFDNSSAEPVVLPSKFPNLLVNGSSGIAVGMATNIPPHNLSEATDAVIMKIDNPDASVEQLMKVLPGPDFPTGGIIRGRSGILAAYTTGRGLLRVRARTFIEEKKDRERIIVSEIPYQVNKSLLIEEIAELVRNRVISDISDIRDESDREGMRIVIELKKGSSSSVVLNQLFSHSRLESTIPVALICLVDGTPVTVSLDKLLLGFIGHRKSVVTKRCEFELNRALERLHIVEGLITALKNIDAVIMAIKESKDTAAAKISLMQKFSLSEKQSVAVLEMRLQKLSSLEQQGLRDEDAQLKSQIAELREILGSPQRIRGIIKSELTEVKEKYGDKRRTLIEDVQEEEFMQEDLIKPEEVAITVSHSGYAKRTLLTEYRQQHRGGKGVIAASTREGDFVEHLFVANTHSYILFFTNHGVVHWLKVYEIPDAGRNARGKAIVNLLNLSQGEQVTAFVPVTEFKGYVLMATRNGTIKKTALDAYSNPRKGGIIAITLEEGDELISVKLTDGSKQVILATKNGHAVRFKESDIRITGRSSKGVRGIKLREDAVIGMVVAEEQKSLLTVCERGYGKRTPISDYRLINRGGYGVINIQTSERNGKVVGIASVSDDDELMLISRNGIMIRVPAKDISIIGRNTQGARIMRMDAKDEVVAVAMIAKTDSSEQN